MPICVSKRISGINVKRNLPPSSRVQSPNQNRAFSNFNIPLSCSSLIASASDDAISPYIPSSSTYYSDLDFGFRISDFPHPSSFIIHRSSLEVLLPPLNRSSREPRTPNQPRQNTPNVDSSSIPFFHTVGDGVGMGAAKHSAVGKRMRPQEYAGE